MQVRIHVDFLFPIYLERKLVLPFGLHCLEYFRFVYFLDSNDYGSCRRELQNCEPMKSSLQEQTGWKGRGL